MTDRRRNSLTKPMILVALLYLAALLMAPFYIGPEVAANAQINAERLLLLVLAATILMGSNLQRVGSALRVLISQRGLLFAVIVGFFVLRLISAFASPYPVSTLIVINELAANLMIFIVFFAIFFHFDIRREIQMVFVVSIVFMFFVACFELALGYNPFTQFAPAGAGMAINAAEMTRDGFLRVKATFEHSLTLGHTIVMLLPFFLFISKSSLALRSTMVGLLVFLAIATGSRSTILLAFVEIGIAAIYYGGAIRFGEARISTRALAISLAAVVLVVAVTIATNTAGKGLFDSYIREAQINNGLIAIRQKLILGYGPGPGALEAIVAGMKGIGAMRMWRANLETVDNWYLTVLLTSGVPAFILFVSMIGLLAKQAFELLFVNRVLAQRLRRHDHHALAVGVATATIFGAAFMAILSIFTVHALFYIFAAWLTATYVHAKERMA